MKVSTLIATTLIALGTTAVSTHALASNSSIQLGKPSYGGNGCPAGSAEASVSPDGKSLSFLFDDYQVEAGGSNRRVNRKSCNLSIPVKVPNGFSVSLIGADYRGFVDVPRGGMARLDSEYFFAGTRGPRFSHVFRGAYSDTYTKNHKLVATSNVWSPCGTSVNLRVNTGMLARGNRHAETLATVDSADFNAGLVYHVRYRRCR